MKSFFEPKSVVVIGASKNKDKLGYGVARNLIGSGFGGQVYFVNLTGGELFGKKIFTSIDEIPGKVDLALIVVQAKLVPDILVACSQNQINNIIILTSGFRESGPEGAKIEEKCKEILTEKGLRVIGPNCIGIIDTQIPIDTTFIQPSKSEKGEIALITQSGALGAALLDWLWGEGVGLSRLISLGNQIDVQESDVLVITAESTSSKSIMLYIESIQNGQRFLKQATKASSLKPVIALKAGHSDAGEKAALSHTGALAGSDAAYEAGFRRSSILRATNTKEMVEWAKILAILGQPDNNRVAILTNAGGPGVIASDVVEENKLRMAHLTISTREELEKILPPAASITNPVDMLASASPEVYAQSLGILLEDPGVDMVLVIAPPPPMHSTLEIAEQLIEVIRGTTKPVAVSLMGSQLVKQAIAKFKEYQIPVFTFPEDGISGFGALWKYKLLQSQSQEIQEFFALENEMVRKILNENLVMDSITPIEITQSLLDAYSIPFLPLHFASDEKSAARISSQIGYPVVMKISADGISHKSDFGGVMLDLRSDKEVVRRFGVLRNKAVSAGLGDGFQGVYIQKMVKSGQEVIIGGVRDPVFGPMVMFGSGGVEVEGLNDIQFALAPVTKGDLEYLIQNTWAGKKLAGYRQFGKKDILAVKDVIVKIAQIMVDFPEIKEIEINPLIVGEGQANAFAADARMIISTPT